MESFIKTSPDCPLEIISSNLGIDWISHKIPTKTKEKKTKGLLCWIKIYLSNVFNEFPIILTYSLNCPYFILYLKINK